MGWIKAQGSGFRVQGSGFRWRLRRLFLEDGILVSQPSPLGNAIKLSGRTFLAPHRGEQVATTLILTAIVCRLKVLFIEIRNASP